MKCSDGRMSASLEFECLKMLDEKK